MKELEGKALVNITRAEVVTEEETPKIFAWETSSSASLEPHVSEGEENILRNKNKILATNKTEDILVGFNLEFEDNVMQPEMFALVDGGKITYDSINTDKVIKYESPIAGEVVKRTLFTLNIYTEEKDIDGETVGYAKFIYKHCKGKPISYEIKDGEFMVPKLSITSRPKAGESPSTIEFLDKLPSGDADILTFSLKEQTGPATINNVSKTIDIEVEKLTSVTALKPTFTLSDGATAKVDITPQVSGSTANDFTSPVTYIVTAENGTVKEWTVTVTVAI